MGRGKDHCIFICFQITEVVKGMLVSGCKGRVIFLTIGGGGVRKKRIYGVCVLLLFCNVFFDQHFPKFAALTYEPLAYHSEYGYEH